MGFDFTIKKGTTSKIIEFMLRDSTTGLGKTGLLTGDMTGSYVREGGTKVALSFTSASAGDSFSTGRWAEVDATNMRGLYQFHLPNASLASGAEAVTFHFNATDVIDKIIRISLLDVDLRDATDAGLSNLDAAVSSRSTVAATDIVSSGAITTSGGAVSNVTTVATTTTNSDMRGTDNALLASSAPSNFGSLGISSSGHLSRVTLVDTTTTNTDMVDVSSLATSSDLATVDTVVDAIKVVTDRLDTALVIDGAVYQFTANALENAPSGGGGGGGDDAATIYSYFTASNRQDTFKADVSGLSTFDPSSQDVTTDAASRAASKADVSSLATSADVSALNDLSQADIRSAIGLASANLDTTLGNIPTVSEFEARTLLASAYFNASTDVVANVTTVGSVTGDVTTDSASRIASRADLSAVATSAEISALNDPSAADIADAVWDESLSQHNTGGTTGKALKQLKEGTITAESSINDSSATATTFVTNLTETQDGFYHDKVIVFISGDLSGQARHVETYTGSTKQIVVSQAFTQAPADSDEFIILAGHEHSLGEIADATWDEERSGHTSAGTFGQYLDAQISGIGASISAGAIWDAQLSDYATAGTFGGRFQEGTRFTNTDANIIYLNRGDSYDNTANPMITWPVTKDYTGYTVVLDITHRVTGASLLSKTIEVQNSTTLRASLSSTDTAFTALTTDADFGAHNYIITATSGGSVDSAVIGAAVIRKT